ncbi:MAG: hypothetical protein ABI212_11025 [Burkholderiaceae bacterium]
MSLDDTLTDYHRRAAEAQAKAAQAYARLLALAEQRNSGQIERVARFLASTFNGQAFPFDVYQLRAVDIAISDDMLCCLDSLRWGKADLHTLVPDGEKRVLQVFDDWSIGWSEL